MNHPESVLSRRDFLRNSGRITFEGFHQIEALGLTLGADVPVFVFGESAFAQGIGEILEPLPLPAAWYLVLTPPVAVPTRPIFDHPDLKRDSKPIKIQGFSAGGGRDSGGIDSVAVNDLEPLVCRLYPEVARHLDWLKQHAPALMTGTGASVFAAFGSEEAAREVMARAPAAGLISGFPAGAFRTGS